jgi:PAS domain S-box-containing protein
MGNQRVEDNVAAWGHSGLAGRENETPLTPTPDLASLLEEVLDATMTLQRADFGDVQLYDEATGTLKIVAHRGVGPEFLEHFAAVDAGDMPACGRALKEGKRIVIEDVTTDPGAAPTRAIAALTGYRGVICTPLFERGGRKPIGLLSTHFREPCRPTERDLRLTDLFARQAADMICARRVEQRLRDSQEHFRLALEAGNMGIWEWDAATNLLKADKAHQALFDLPPQDDPRPNEVYWALMDPDESDIGRQRAMDALASGSDIEIELRVRPSEGVVRWIAVRGRPRNSGSGSIIGISYDITDRRHREERLRESEGRLRAAANLVNLGLYSWNPQTNELQWDETVKAMWGLPPEAAATYDAWRAGIHPDDLDRVEAAIAQAADPAGEGRYDMEYRVIGLRDGVERWIGTRGQTHFEGNKAVAFDGAALDVTDRKRTENVLEHRVEARTLALEESNASLVAEIEQRRQIGERLDVIQAELFHASRLSVAGQMAAVIAHELSQPLTATLNSVNAARRLLVSNDPGRDAALRELTEEAGNEIERASEILRRLRFFIRRGSVNRVPEPVAPMVEEAVAFTAVGPNALGVKISQYFDPLVPNALVDRVQIQQVISNLVRNSLEAMYRQPQRELTVATAASDDAFLELIVSDNGPGVADEMVPSLFEPFKTDKPGGMGLGLSICKSIVEAHGGRISYEPSFDGGSVFRFTLQVPPGEAAK